MATTLHITLFTGKKRPQEGAKALFSTYMKAHKPFFFLPLRPQLKDRPGIGCLFEGRLREMSVMLFTTSK